MTWITQNSLFPDFCKSANYSAWLLPRQQEHCASLPKDDHQKSLHPWKGSFLGGGGREVGRKQLSCSILWLLGMWEEQGHHRLSWAAPVVQKTHIPDIVQILALNANFCRKLGSNKCVVHKQAWLFIKLLELSKVKEALIENTGIICSSLTFISRAGGHWICVCP